MFLPYTIQPKGNGKKGHKGCTCCPPKTSNWPAHKSQRSLVYSSAVGEVLSDVDRTVESPVKTVEMGMLAAMDLLLDISSHLQATEHVMDEVKSDRAVEATQRQESPSCSTAANSRWVKAIDATPGAPPKIQQGRHPWLLRLTSIRPSEKRWPVGCTRPPSWTSFPPMSSQSQRRSLPLSARKRP